jgi:hypothetical protein
MASFARLTTGSVVQITEGDGNECFPTVKYSLPKAVSSIKQLKRMADRPGGCIGFWREVPGRRNG